MTRSLPNAFNQQYTLPRQPIPSLHETCKHFLTWIKPLLTTTEFKNSQLIVDKFQAPGGIGDQLQQELIRQQQRQKETNWTTSLWNDIYLQPRSPLILQGNVFYALQTRAETQNLSQTALAASLITTILKFREAIETGKLPADKSGDMPLCMHQYQNIFSATRIARRQRDMFRVSSGQRHIIVLRDGDIFALEVLEPSGRIHPTETIEKALERITLTARDLTDSTVTTLTSGKRNKWAEAREHLLGLNRQNTTIFELIDSALFVVCLDNHSPPIEEDAARLMLLGDGTNRWYDKSQFIVTANNKVGINMEHTGVDGTVMGRMIRFIHDNLLDTAKPGKQETKLHPTRLDFITDQTITDYLQKAKKEFSENVSNQALRILSFKKFGTSHIKQLRASPDAFVQLALQAAQYTLFDRCFSTYEPVSTRNYDQGRIEVMYTVTQESLRFAQILFAESHDTTEKRQAFYNAAQAHVDRIRQCRNGYGVDSHLRTLLRVFDTCGSDLGIDNTPEIFADVGYQRLIHTVLCTSTTSPHGLRHAGFGPVVENGFGIRYIKDDEEIRFTLTSRRDNEPSLKKLESYIARALTEISRIMK